MRKSYRFIVQSFMWIWVLLALGVTPAFAIVVKDASLVGSNVQVSGGQAARSADISWEGVVVARASKGGSFSFTTANVPSDCLGTLSDGSSTIEVAIAGCGGSASNLTATGQTMSYAAGDDGALQTGVPLSYTDNGDGTVTDNSTGLMWEKKTDVTVNQVFTWYDALGYVASLNMINNGAGFAGHNDWRMPNMRELLSMIDYSRSAPPIDAIFGPTLGALNFVNFWSSTSSATDGDLSAWAVDFQTIGGMLTFGKGSALRVRAVRDAR